MRKGYIVIDLYVELPDDVAPDDVAPLIWQSAHQLVRECGGYAGGTFYSRNIPPTFPAPCDHSQVTVLSGN